MPIDPINGNNGFSTIKNSTNQLPNLNVVDVTAINIDSGPIIAETILAYSVGTVARGKQLKTIKLNSSSTNLTWMQSGQSFAMNLDGTNIPFQFPVLYGIVSVTIIGNDLEGTPTPFPPAPPGTVINVGTAVTPTNIDMGILNGCPFTDVNNGVYISGQIYNNFGSDGRPTVFPGFQSRYVVLSTSNYPVTAGSVSVILTYYEF